MPLTLATSHWLATSPRTGLGGLRLAGDRPLAAAAKSGQVDVQQVRDLIQDVDAMVASGADTWYFIQADYAFGEAMATDLRKAVEARGGKVLGVSKHPRPRRTSPPT